MDIKQPGMFIFFNLIFAALLACFYFFSFLTWEFYVFWFLIYAEMLQAAWIHKEQPGKTYHDYIYWILGVLLNLLIVSSLVEHFTIQRSSLALTLVGVSLAIAALVIRHFGIKNLGINFSEHIKVPKKVVVTGMYKYIRHPIYMSSMLYVFSLPLVLNSYYSLAISVLICILLNVRADLEERILIKQDNYKEYITKTNKFLPRA